LAWRLHQGENIIPIAGTRSRERLTENVKAADIALAAETLEKISELAAPGMDQGKPCCHDVLSRIILPQSLPCGNL